LGSTGSIGKNTLEIVRHCPDSFRVDALSTNLNTDVLYQQIKEFKPSFACVNNYAAAGALRKKLKNSGVRIFEGSEGLKEMIFLSRARRAVVAISGSSALGPLLSVIESGKDVALANKEALVMAGPIIMRMARRRKIKIIPIDSEQSAIWQCLRCEDRRMLKKIYLTASGGPFRLTGKHELKGISVDRVIKHPRWKMGPKISVDCASLMNKGLELLETMFLFGIGPDRIEILIHPESIVHSMVEFIDGSILAQLSYTDMRIPIQYALTYPSRMPSPVGQLDLCRVKSLNFSKPDFARFPCLGLAYEAAQRMGTFPVVLNAANEESVEMFLNRRLDFLDIPKVIRRVFNRHRSINNPGLSDVVAVDAWARQEASNVIESIK